MQNLRINVEYKAEADAFFVTSPDEPGLLVVSHNRSKLCDLVDLALADLKEARRKESLRKIAAR